MCSCSTGSTSMGRTLRFSFRPRRCPTKPCSRRGDECAPHHPPVHETRPARRHRSRSAHRRGARAGGSHRGFGARDHRGEGAGQRLRRVLKDPATGVRTAPLCVASRGFSLHAATRIAGPDRRGLERLCRYVARPALAGGRLRILDSEHLSFALKTPWSDGTSHLVLSPLELLERLAALVPRPGSISCATTVSWRPVPGTATASCPPSRLRSRRLWTAIRAPNPAAIGWGGRPCWRGCFPPSSAHARAVAGACGSSPPSPIRSRSGPIWRG